MNKKLKRIMTLITVMMFIFTTMMATGMTAFAAGEGKVWYVGWNEEKTAIIGWEGIGSEMEVDTQNYYKDSRYSIKTSNATEYNYSRVVKTVEVEPLTTYKFSAMVKYSGYKLEPNAERASTGASLAVSRDGVGVFASSNRVHNSEWTALELKFQIGAEQTECELQLWNGDQNGKCKGTAWFSDIKLEKAETTNQWNVLAVIYKNVDTHVKLDDQTVTVDNSLNSTDISRIKKN